jgi:hypothetical protein
LKQREQESSGEDSGDIRIIATFMDKR